MYNKFLLFGGSNYYPSGGFDDFIRSFDTIGEVNSYASGINDRYDWMHVVNTETRELLEVGIRLPRKY